MPVIGESATSAFVREGNIIRRDTYEATPADAMTWQDVYNYESRSDAPAEVTQESVSAADRAEMDAYMDALAQDENILTDDPYTPADAVYDAQLRRLQQSEAPPAAEREQDLQADLDELASLYADQADVIGRREYLQDATSDMVTDKTTPKSRASERLPAKRGTSSTGRWWMPGTASRSCLRRSAIRTCISSTTRHGRRPLRA